FVLLFKGGVGATPSVGAQGLLDRQTLLWKPSAGISAVECSPCNCGSDARKWIERRNGPIRTEGQHRAGIQHRLPGVARPRALLPYTLFGPAPVINGVVRLHGG